MVRFDGCWIVVALLFQCVIKSGAESIDASVKCERLKASLTYPQEKAPSDLSAVISMVVEKVNRVLEGVVDVEVEWGGGDLHGKVGEHIVKCKVTRLASVVPITAVEDVLHDTYGRPVVEQCFHIPFTILDTNECTLPVGHIMRHQCHAPSQCVNTVGSYECICPLLNDHTENDNNERNNQDEDDTNVTAKDDGYFSKLATSLSSRSPWELSLNSSFQSSCPSSASTHQCCSEQGHSTSGATCRSAFRCPVDPCSNPAANECDVASNAMCQRTKSPLESTNYMCQCPHGLMGNGRTCRPGIDAKPKPMLKFDQRTPTAKTVQNDFYCGCTKPVVDVCDGFPPCEGKHEMCTTLEGRSGIALCDCKSGFKKVQGYGCVDESPPILKLRNDPNQDGVTRLTQGDIYKETAVDIIDDNAEEYGRSLKIAYSQPLPSGCLTNTGQFHVNYTVATPWTSPPYVQVTRRVIIQDINECQLLEGDAGDDYMAAKKYESTCPELVPRCDLEKGAKCINTDGSYTCQCPKYTDGDGFQVIHSNLLESMQSTDNQPKGYKGGTGCLDTSKPVIDLLGPNPKVLKACKCGGLTGIMSKTQRNADDDNEDNSDLLSDQRKTYEDEIKDLIKITSGAELCASHGNPNPAPKDCIKATDNTHKGAVDLTSRVKIGDPVKKSAHAWRIPYNVVDNAGNEATTVWRDVVIEEVDLYDLEHKIRMEVQQEKQAEINEGVQKALEQERKRNEKAKQAEINQAVKKALEEDRKHNEPARGGRSGRSRATATIKDCPECPKCECADGDKSTTCKDFCSAHADSFTCPSGEKPVRVTFLIELERWLEGAFPSSVLYTVMMVTVTVIAMFFLRNIMTFLYQNLWKGNDSYYSNPYDRQQLQTAYDTALPPRYASSFDPNRPRISTPGSEPLQRQPPTASYSRGVDTGGGLFSPPENRLPPNGRIGMASPFLSPHAAAEQESTPGTGHFDDSIYQTNSVITPSRTGDGEYNGNQTPYNLRRRT